jgi:DNA mismatch repair protein MutS
VISGVQALPATIGSHIQPAATGTSRLLPPRWHRRLRLWEGHRPRNATDPSFLHKVQKLGCPVCNSVANYESRFFFWFFHETYHVIEGLVQFIDGLGFCNWHAQRLMTLPGVRSQLGFVHAFAAARLQRLSDERPNKPLYWRGRCIACDGRNERMQRNAVLMTGLLHDPQHSYKYRYPVMLCSPHLRLVLMHAADSVFEPLVENHAAPLAATFNKLTDDWRTRRIGKDDMRRAVFLAAGENSNLADPPGFTGAFVMSEREPPRNPVVRLASDIGQSGNCPICRNVWTRSMAAIDKAARDGSQVDDLVPTCAEHVWIAFTAGSEELAYRTTAVALRVALSPLQTALDWLRRPAKILSTGIRRWFDERRDTCARRLQIAREVLAIPDRCPVCVQLKETKDRMLDLLFRLLAKSHYRPRYERGCGLCLRHFSRAIQLGPDPPTRNFLIRTMHDDLALLEWELEEGSRNTAWSARLDEREEGHSAVKALQRFSGLMRLREFGEGCTTAKSSVTDDLGGRGSLSCSPSQSTNRRSVMPNDESRISQAGPKGDRVHGVWNDTAQSREIAAGTSAHNTPIAGYAAFQSVLYLPGQDDARSAPRDAATYFHDLNLDQIIASITAGKDEYDLKPFFHAPLKTIDAIHYRQEVMRDLEGSQVLACINSFAAALRLMREKIAQIEKLYCKEQKERWFLHAVEVYCPAVRELSERLSELPLASRGLLAFRDYLTSYVRSDRFVALRAEVSRLARDLAEIRYCLLIRSGSFTVREYISEQDYSVDIVETFKKFQQGAVKDYQVEFHNPVNLNHIEAKVLESVALLCPETFFRLEAFAAHNRSFADSTLTRFDREIQFYVAYAEYIRRLKRVDLQFCYPEVSDTDKAEYGHEAFDLALATKLVAEDATVVCNDHYLKGKERIIVVSGPNQGGKTTFARTFGQLHHLASIGCPVPGREARLYLFDAMFTHFEKEEDIKNLHGKLQDDLLRIHRILERATPRSVIIINEIFNSTTLRDAVFLARNVMNRIIELDSLCVCVTFLDELASLSEKIVSMVSTVMPDNPTERTFMVVRRPADGRAYAISIAQKYRLTYAEVKARIPDDWSERDTAKGRSRT